MPDALLVVLFALVAAISLASSWVLVSRIERVGAGFASCARKVSISGVISTRTDCGMVAAESAASNAANAARACSTLIVVSTV